MKLKLAVIAALAVSSLAASTITTGSKSGSYYKIGAKLSTIVPMTVQKSKGSTQNLDRVSKGEADFGIVQKDDYKRFMDKNPGAPIELIGDLKMECLYVVSSTTSKVEADTDMQKDGVKVAIGKKGAGTQATWAYMKSLESGFKKATGIPKGGLRALAGLTSGTYDAALFMQTPATTNKLVKTVLANEALRFVPVTDWDLNDKLPSGQPVYTHEKIDLASGFLNDTELKTICTTASVITNTEADEDTIDEVIDVLLNSKNFLLSN
jgi:TRAP-type uncharacterized transport system substrate-binding protein